MNSLTASPVDGLGQRPVPQRSTPSFKGIPESDEEPSSPAHPLSETPQDGPYRSDSLASTSIPEAEEAVSLPFDTTRKAKAKGQGKDLTSDTGDERDGAERLAAMRKKEAFFDRNREARHMELFAGTSVSSAGLHDSGTNYTQWMFESAMIAKDRGEDEKQDLGLEAGSVSSGTSSGKEKVTIPSEMRLPSHDGKKLSDNEGAYDLNREQQRGCLKNDPVQIRIIQRDIEAEKKDPASEWEDLIVILQETKKNQKELITEMKIRIAVLENELKHSEESKQTAVHESAVLARVLGSKLSPPTSDSDSEKIDNLKCEIKMLRRENAALWTHLEGRKADKFHSSSSPTTLSESDDSSYHICHAPARARTRRGKVASEDNNIKYTTPPIFSKGFKGKGIEHNTGSNARERRVSFEPLIPDFEPSTSSSMQPTGVYPIHIDRKSSWGVGQRCTGKSAWNSSFCDGGTVPNSPILSPTPLANTPSPFDLDRIRLGSLQNLDVGISSLEDVLDGAGFLSPELASWEPKSSFQGPTTQQRGEGMRAQGKLLERERLGIDVDLDEHLKTLEKLENLPMPGVLQAGFEIEGSFRGREYAHLKQKGGFFKGIPRGPRCSFRSYAPDYPSFGSTFTGSGASFEIPKERSQYGNLWRSQEERGRAIETNRQASGRDSRVFPDFFRYGICYTPSETDTNYLRTVIITNLPPDVDVRELLARVRGGEIISTFLMNTIKITGAMSAMVQFLQEGAAEDYAQYTQDHPITFDDNQKAVVTILATPTWPLSISSVRRIREHHHTRCLAISDLPHFLTRTGLERDLAKGNGYRAASLVEIYISNANTMHLEFSSVSAAGASFGLLTSMHRYKGLKICFERDPCARSLDELRLPLPRRHSMLPAQREPSPEFSQDSSFSSLKERNARLGENSQHKRLITVGNGPITMPSFSGKGLRSSSWADEMNGDFDESDGSETQVAAHSTFETKVHCLGQDETINPPNSPREGSIASRVMSVEDFNYAMVSNIRKPSVGLAESNYASFVPYSQNCIQQSQSLNSDETIKYDESPTFNPYKDTDSLRISTRCDDNHTSKGLDNDTNAIITSESERSFSQTATRLLDEREAARASSFPEAQAKTPPRANLSSLIDSSPSSAQPSTKVDTFDPHGLVEIYTTTSSKQIAILQTELQSSIDPAVSDAEGAQCTSNPSPDVNDEQYIPKGEWSVVEANTLMMGLDPMSKEVYRKRLTHTRQIPETQGDLKIMAGGKINGPWDDHKGKGKAFDVPIPHPKNPVTPASMSSFDEESSFSSTLERSTTQHKISDAGRNVKDKLHSFSENTKALLPSNELFQSSTSFDTVTAYQELSNTVGKSFILGHDLLDDVFWDGPGAIPPMTAKKEAKATNLDAIVSDLDDDFEAVGEGGASKEFLTRQPSFKTVDKKNSDEELLRSPTQANKVSQLMGCGEDDMEAAKDFMMIREGGHLFSDCAGI